MAASAGQRDRKEVTSQEKFLEFFKLSPLPTSDERQEHGVT